MIEAVLGGRGTEVMKVARTDIFHSTDNLEGNESQQADSEGGGS
jgi:hypothetical protein